MGKTVVTIFGNSRPSLLSVKTIISMSFGLQIDAVAKRTPQLTFWFLQNI